MDDGSNEFDDEEEFYDSEIEPSICEEYVNESLNESIVSELPKTYYAVQFKKDSINCENSEDRIFMHQENAIKLLKKDPTNRRFKSFKSFKEAYAFSYEFEYSEHVPTLSEAHASIDPLRDKTNQKNSDAEKLPFSAPKKPEVNQLRQYIEKNDLEMFKNKVLSNPRFLISAGDTPNLCQESFRYNCLHVCAKENRYEICEFLLRILSSTSYIQKLYKNDNIEQSKIRSNHLIDLYLNMPEKGLNETPLHFACKFGSLEVARLMISFEACNRNVKNKHGKTPEDLICTKASTQKAKDNACHIKSLFEDCFYVPLYRDDESGDVIVDKPSPKISLSLKPSLPINGVNVNGSKSDMMFNKFSPSISYESNRKLAAYVGPVSPKNANAIYDRLKSPARLRQSPNNLDILRGDDYKGYERIIRQLTDEMKLPWTEFWAFLNGFSDLKSKKGLNKLEIYLEQKKLHGVLNSQKKNALNIRNEQNMNLFNPIKRNTDLIANLEALIKIIDEIKNILELKENVLSSRYEKYIQIIRENKSNSNPIDDIEENDDLSVESLRKVLDRYMNAIMTICKLNKDSTQCYFDIYKTSKVVFEFLNSEEKFSKLTFSPNSTRNFSSGFKAQNPAKKLTNQTHNKTMKRLTPKKKEMTNPFLQMRGSQPVCSSDDEDNEDSKNGILNSSSDGDDDEFIKKMKNLEPFKRIETPKANTFIKSDSENLDFLISQISTSMKIEEKIKSETDDENYSLNKVDNLKPVFNGFKKPAVIKGICRTNHAFKLFMYGETPSKLDRAVYLAIKDTNQDLESYKLLNEWYDYMSHCNKSEMNTWKTPMRRQILFSNC